MTSRCDMPLPPIPNTRPMSLPPVYVNAPNTAPVVHGQTGSNGHEFQHGLADTSFTEDGYEMPRRLPEGCACPTYLEILPSILDECVDSHKMEDNENSSTTRYGSVTM